MPENLPKPNNGRRSELYRRISAKDLFKRFPKHRNPPNEGIFRNRKSFRQRFSLDSEDGKTVEKNIVINQIFHYHRINNSAYIGGIYSKIINYSVYKSV